MPGRGWHGGLGLLASDTWMRRAPRPRVDGRRRSRWRTDLPVNERGDWRPLEYIAEHGGAVDQASIAGDHHLDMANAGCRAVTMYGLWHPRLQCMQSAVCDASWRASVAKMRRWNHVSPLVLGSRFFLLSVHLPIAAAACRIRSSWTKSRRCRQTSDSSLWLAPAPPLRQARTASNEPARSAHSSGPGGQAQPWDLLRNRRHLS